MKKTYFVFVIQGYDEMKSDGMLTNVVYFELIAKNKKEAIRKAKKIELKNYYRLQSVIERF